MLPEKKAPTNLANAMPKFAKKAITMTFDDPPLELNLPPTLMVFLLEKQEPSLAEMGVNVFLHVLSCVYGNAFAVFKMICLLAN